MKLKLKCCQCEKQEKFYDEKDALSQGWHLLGIRLDGITGISTKVFVCSKCKKQYFDSFSKTK